MSQLPLSGFCCSGSTIGTSCVYEAPKDGTPYNRQDGNWVSVEVQEAPIDGTPYVRQDAGWVPQAAGSGNAVLTSGAVDPNGVVVGLSSAHLHVQIVGGLLARLWVFNGVVGANIGWI